jgi:predicted CXXCH cytochrome family protein
MRLKIRSGVGLLLIFLFTSYTYSENPGTYVGWEKCEPCHQDIVSTWQNSRHAKAIESLKKTGQENLPACVKCHTTGYEEEGGFIDYELTPEMAGVQCEVCHGPESNHVMNPGEDNIIENAGAALCRQCHTEKQDPGFNYEEKIKQAHGPSK